ncbi:MAG: hypothetical protein ACJ760_05425 [Thermoleophilaceae bacterium]
MNTITAAALTVAAIAAPSAMANGGSGSGGGGTTATTTTTTASYCPQDGPWVVQLDDGSTVFANEASGGGCVWVRSYPAGYLRLDHVDLAPGWTYVVKSNGAGTSSRVQLQFTETATGRTVDFRVEFGKTKIG